MTDAAPYIEVKVFKTEPHKEGEGWFQDFQIESAQPLSIIALLARVHEADLTPVCCSFTCFKGKCSSCLVQDVFGCTTLVKPGESIVVFPGNLFVRVLFVRQRNKDVK